MGPVPSISASTATADGRRISEAGTHKWPVNGFVAIVGAQSKPEPCGEIPHPRIVEVRFIRPGEDRMTTSGSTRSRMTLVVDGKV